MRELTELRELQRYFQEREAETSLVANFCRSPRYLDELGRLEREDEGRAYLTVCLLKTMALDPKVGAKLEDHVPDAVGQNALVFVNLQFFRSVNFIGPVYVQRDSLVWDALRCSIRDNLASQQSKAAGLVLRLERRCRAQLERVSLRASEAATQVYNQGYKAATEDWRYAQPRLLLLRGEAQEAREAVYRPVRERLDRRLHRVQCEAYAPGYRGNAYEAMARFVDSYVRPARRMQ